MKLDRKATERSTRQGSQECGCWKILLQYLASECAENKEILLSADQINLTPQSTKGGKLELAPKTAILSIDHHFHGFSTFARVLAS